MDLQYNWVEKSADWATILAVSSWLSDQVKESPNDEMQTMPEHDYTWPKGEQRNVFLQVMAYFKRMETDFLGPKPPPLRINVDHTAGTGKSFLIWGITTALQEHFNVGEDAAGAKDPTVRLAPTGISALKSMAGL
jgi:hypothetical protein